MRAIEIFLEHYEGNQSAAARALGKKQQHVWHWLNISEDMPAKYVPKAARLIGKTPADLLPDIFGDVA
jgi:DNA-binding transcriptional regulator YdaS (Cro superfamily)